MNTHEELLLNIKKGRELAQSIVELSESRSSVAEIELWKSASALVMMIDNFSGEAVKDIACAASLLNCINDVMSDKILPLILLVTITL